jgi:DNA-binding CsgD family transcriptional regulator
LGSTQLSDVDLAARVARLSAGQRECLDLVDDHATSKEIARQLGISRHTVDARLRGAIQTLGVTSRREAAIIFRAAMQAQAYQPLAYQPPRIVSEAARIETSMQDLPCGEIDDATGADIPALPHAATIGERRAAAVRDAGYMADSAVWSAAALPDIQSGSRAGSSSGQPLLRLWGGANDLSPHQRLLGIFIVMIAGMLAFGLLLSGISALTLLRT